MAKCLSQRRTTWIEGIVAQRGFIYQQKSLRREYRKIDRLQNKEAFPVLSTVLAQASTCLDDSTFQFPQVAQGVTDSKRHPRSRNTFPATSPTLLSHSLWTQHPPTNPPPQLTTNITPTSGPLLFLPISSPRSHHPYKANLPHPPPPISPLPLKPTRRRHHRHTLIHHPLPHAQIFPNPFLRLLALGHLVGIYARGEACGTLHAGEEGGD